VLLRAELFVAVAGASSYLYAEAFPSQELLYWVTGHHHVAGRATVAASVIVGRPVCMFMRYPRSREISACAA
jgi:hypothetical protein